MRLNRSSQDFLRTCVFTCFGFLSLNTSIFVVGVDLENDGGYVINAAIEESTPEPSDPAKFKDNFQAMMQAFSNQMVKSTKEKFFIGQVKLLIPSHWTRFDTRMVQPKLQYKNADIRISSKIVDPVIDNPYECKLSGNWMEVPLEYFTKIHSSQFGQSYGNIPKLLVRSWARLQWGVWEEHGVPGEIRHPSFFKISGSQDPWKATGCSDEEIEGQFLDGVESECNVTRDQVPPHCRFVPFANNTATTSLMSYMSLKTVDQFCDQVTHNKNAPNRQNLFCRGSSIWETIRETSDYKNVDKNSGLRSLWLSLIKHSDKPYFYMLLDNRQSQLGNLEFASLKKSLDDIWKDIPEDTISGFGYFPADNKTQSCKYISEVVPWRATGMAGTSFRQEMGNIPSPKDSGINFALAVQEKINEIVSLNHPYGVILLIAKLRVDTEAFESTAFEQEIISSLAGSNIRIIGVEFQSNHLQQLSEASSEGFHVSLPINDADDISSRMGDLRLNLTKVFSEKIPLRIGRANAEVRKMFVKPNDMFSLDLKNYEWIEIFLTTLSNTTEWNDFSFEPSHEKAEGKKTRAHEWNAKSGRMTIGRRMSWKAGVLSKMNLSYTCQSEELMKCKGFLVVTSGRGDSEDTTGIDIEISTNAIDNFLDFSVLDVSVGYFKIFARVRQNGKPLVANLNVTAKVRSQEDTWSEDLLTLSDDGTGHPDISTGDGIYSGYYVPRKDGSHKISVNVQIQSRKINGSTPQTNDSSVALQVDQFCKTVDYGSLTRFKNRAQFILLNPLRILDLKVNSLPNATIEITFTNPGVFGLKDANVNSYQIYYSKSSGDLINLKPEGNLTVCKVVPRETVQIIQIDLWNSAQGLYYFAVQSFHYTTAENGSIYGLFSELSNIGLAWTSEKLRPPIVETVQEQPFLSTTGIVVLAGTLILIIFISIGIYAVLKIRSKASLLINVPI